MRTGVRNILMLALLSVFVNVSGACPEYKYESGGPLGGEFKDGEAEVSFNLAVFDIITETKLTDVLEDMGDGTVKLTVLKEYIHFGTVQGVYYVEFLKKCLQGQVYRPDYNDCQGAGDANNYYNASLLQYCDKNDNSCNDSIGLDGTGNSEAYQSCNQDTTAGRKWQIDFKNSIDRELFNSKIMLSSPIYSHLPRDGQYWVVDMLTEEKASYKIIPEEPIESQDEWVYAQSDYKSERKLVLCITFEGS